MFAPGFVAYRRLTDSANVAICNVLSVINRWAVIQFLVVIISPRYKAVKTMLAISCC